jgi:hypothetical protein
MRKILAGILCAACIAYAGCGGNKGKAGVFEFAQGAVLVQRINSTQFIPVKAGDIVFFTETVKTSPKSSAGLSFPNGIRISLGENTTMEVPQVGMGGSSPSAVKALQLTAGKLWAQLAKQRDPFEVRTRGVIIAVKGTVFQTEADQAGKTTLTVFEGKVDMGNKAGKVEVAAGQQSTAQVSAAPQAPVKVDLSKVEVPAGPEEFYKGAPVPTPVMTPTVVNTPTPVPTPAKKEKKKPAVKPTPAAPKKQAVEATPAAPVKEKKRSAQDVIDQMNKVKQNARDKLDKLQQK